MKTLGNKGFSLVELIIVIAIMAILAGALAPALIRYLEKSREAADIESMKQAKLVADAAYADGDAEAGMTYYFDTSGWITESKPDKGYGKGTASDGHSDYEGYDSTKNVVGKYLMVTYDDKGSASVYWATEEASKLDVTLSKLSNVLSNKLVLSGNNEAFSVGKMIASNKADELNKYIQEQDINNTTALINCGKSDSEYMKKVVGSDVSIAQNNIKMVSVTADGKSLSEYNGGDDVEVVQYIYYMQKIDGKNTMVLYGVRGTTAKVKVTGSGDTINRSITYDKSDEDGSTWTKM